MRLLFVISLMILSGCGWNYTVADRTVRACLDKNIIVCELQTPLFWNNERVAVCQTYEECSKICEDKRKESK